MRGFSSVVRDWLVTRDYARKKHATGEGAST